MLKSTAAVILFGTALAAGSATAQTTGAPQQGSGAAPAAQAQPGSPANIQYITENRQNLWRASQLDGVNVYNERNERIGDITEVLLNSEGQVEAVVIGVGGFLGIGQRDVAVPFNALQWQMERTNGVATRPTTGTTGTAAEQQGGMTQPAPGPSAAGTTRGNTAGTMTGGTARTDQMNDRPERAILAGASKDQLSNAPEFRYGR
jgi:sporulation protein YlmC with PRC-barrel domain